MNKILLPALLCVSLSLVAQKKEAKTKPASTPAKTETKMQSNATTVQKMSIYDFIVEDINGKKFDMASLKGKKVIIVNTASKCGLTPQYEDLEKMYQVFGKDGLVIVGFPANDFAEQEPGTNLEIATFCQKNYGVTFPMMAKVSVKGDQMAPIYKFLTQRSQNGSRDSEVAWNFQKYLIGRDGRIEQIIAPKERLDGNLISKWMKS